MLAVKAPFAAGYSFTHNQVLSVSSDCAVNQYKLHVNWRILMHKHHSRELQVNYTQRLVSAPDASTESMLQYLGFTDYFVRLLKDTNISLDCPSGMGFFNSQVHSSTNKTCFI